MPFLVKDPGISAFSLDVCLLRFEGRGGRVAACLLISSFAVVLMIITYSLRGASHTHAHNIPPVLLSSPDLLLSTFHTLFHLIHAATFGAGKVILSTVQTRKPAQESSVESGSKTHALTSLCHIDGSLKSARPFHGPLLARVSTNALTLVAVTCTSSLPHPAPPSTPPP